jgi:hypothetical protein
MRSSRTVVGVVVVTVFTGAEVMFTVGTRRSGSRKWTRIILMDVRTATNVDLIMHDFQLGQDHRASLISHRAHWVQFVLTLLGTCQSAHDLDIAYKHEK